MLAAGLTGGIGAGKSSVTRLLSERTAVIIDADRIAHEVSAPGGPAFAAVVERFGHGVLDAGGELDRRALAEIVFGDPRALADLNALTHPVIGAVMAERLGALAGGDAIVVVDVPLLTSAHRDALGLRAIVVVDCPVDVAVERLVRERGMDERDARARVAAQPAREERLSLADYVVDNSSGPEHLVGEVERLWEWLQALRRAPGAPGAPRAAGRPGPPGAAGRPGPRS